MKVLFLCAANSARSQMAEGLLRALSNGAVESSSAGTEPKGLNPLAVGVMDDIGIDIRGQSSKHLESLLDQRFDYVISVCDRVQDTCPMWPGAKEHIRWSFEDPALVSDPRKARIGIESRRAVQK